MRDRREEQVQEEEEGEKATHTNLKQREMKQQKKKGHGVTEFTILTEREVGKKPHTHTKI